MSGNAGGGAGGGAGAGAGGGGPAAGPGPAVNAGAGQAADTGQAKPAGPVEVIDAQGRSLGEFGQDGRPTPPNVSFAKADAERGDKAVDLARLERLSALQDAKAAEARGWSPEAAEARAASDVASLRAAASDEDRFKALHDMGVAARNNRTYRETVSSVDADAMRAVQEQQKSTVQVTGAELRELREAGLPATASPRYVDTLERRFGAELAAAEQVRPPEGQRERDFARELVERVAKDSADPQPKPEADIVRSIEQRAELAEAAYLRAKQPALDALPKQADGTVSVNDRLAELRKRDVEPVPPETARQWAEVDARDFRRLQELPRQEDAAVAMAETARTNATYKATLAEKSADVAERVEALDAANTAKVVAKEERKAVEFADMQRVKDKDAANEPVPPRGDAANDATRGATMAIDAATMERLAAARARDTRQAAEDLGLNGIEPAVERREQQQLDGEADAKRSAWLKKGQEAQAEPDGKPAQARETGGNKIDSDEVFTATQTEVKPIVPAEVEQKYLRVGDKFYHPKNTDVVAFEDKGNRLETRSDSEQVAETLVTIARARGWDEIKVSGTETFRKEVWLEAAAHGMHVKGYTPTEQDKAELAKRTREIEANKVEQDAKPFRAREAEAAPESAKPNEGVSLKQAMQNVQAAHEAQAAADRQARAQAFAQKPAAEVVKDHPELAGTYAAVASIERKMDADNLTPQQRAIVNARVRANVLNAIERGELPEVQVREERQVERQRSEDREVSR